MGVLRIPNIGTFDCYLFRAGAGRPLLFLHGYERHPGGARFLERLAERHEVFAPELPGYGASTGFEHLHDVHDVALYHRALIESWGIDRIDVVGHSLGGMFAAELAALAPECVHRLILVNAFGLWLDEEPALDPFGDPKAVVAAKWHGEPIRPEPTNFVATADERVDTALFQNQNLGSATRFMWPIADRGLRRRLPYVQAPTLIVHGAADGLLPVAYARELARLIPRAELALIDAAGHYPMLEQEDRFVTVVESYLEGH